MDFFECGQYKYIDDLSKTHLNKLPESLKLCSCSSEAVLLRLFSGSVKMQSESGIIMRQKIDYTTLSYTESTRDNQAFSRILTEIFSSDEAVILCNRYFSQNRKNSRIYNQMLIEITKYFMNEKKSPTVAFIHLYRCLEFMSYSFPLIYASKSKDFMGTFTNLKNFLKGDVDGELKFFKNFTNEMFLSEPTTLTYIFEMPVNSDNLEKLSNEFKRVILPHNYEFEDGMIRVEFQNMHSLFVTIRNRYFHNLVGQNNKNIEAFDYCIDDLFLSLNSHFLNWIAYIFITILQHGYISTT